MKNSLADRICAANEDLLVAGNMDAVVNYFTPDYIVHITEQDMSGGHKAVQKVIGKLRHSFPDLQVEVEIFLESETQIAWQRVMRGTLKNSYQGFPASDASIVWRDMVVSQFKGDQIAEEWVVTDLAERLLLSRKTK